MTVFAEKIYPVIHNALERESIVGTSVIVAKDSEIVFEAHLGMANREEQKPVSKNTQFRLASMTKPLVSVAALALVEQGILDLDAPITQWLPDFTPKLPDGSTPIITLRHLLSHTSGLSYGFLTSDNEPYHSFGISDGMDEKVLSLEENLRRLAQVPLLFKPGSAWCYSIATDVIGAILEKACQKPLSEIVKAYVTEPLGMHDTLFHLSSIDNLAKAYADSKEANGRARLMDKKDQVILAGCGPIHYAPCRVANLEAYPSGGTGMVGTAHDYIKFLETIRKGGAPILQQQSARLLTEDAVKGYDVAAAGPGYGFSLGFAVVRDSLIANTPRNISSYEWGGVYGTAMFVDPVAKLSVVMLTNTALEGLMGEFPVSITQAIYSAIAAG